MNLKNVHISDISAEKCSSKSSEFQQLLITMCCAIISCFEYWQNNLHCKIFNVLIRCWEFNLIINGHQWVDYLHWNKNILILNVEFFLMGLVVPRMYWTTFRKQQIIIGTANALRSIHTVDCTAPVTSYEATA